jgi:uncharacterized repeat protein (TIGR02543 family)
MATLTKTHVEYASKYLTYTNGKDVYVKLYMRYTEQDSVNNRTYVEYAVGLTYLGSTYAQDGGANSYAKIQGTNASEKKVMMYNHNGGKVNAGDNIIATTGAWVTHNADGTKSVTGTASAIWTLWNNTLAEAKGTVDLPTITRYEIQFETHDGVPEPSTMYCVPGSSITLPAKCEWDDVTISTTVTLDAMGGTCNPTSLTSSGVRDFTFAGWFSTDDYVYRAAGSSYTPTKSETIYADFNYTDRYNAVTLPTPTRDNYIFKGWATRSTATSGITGSYTPTGSTTLYATWELDQVVAYVKTAGVWKQGRMYVKINDKWEKVKRTYVKKGGSWIEGD